ncbi:MAG: hypothetical protein V4662_27620 [Verrucomicrobiota bacterium]
MESALFIALIFGLGSLFAWLGFRGLRTGVAMLQGYRFKREESYGLFISVTGMWFSAATLFYAFGIAAILGLFVS